MNKIIKCSRVIQLTFRIFHFLRQEVKFKIAKLIVQNGNVQIDCEIGQHGGVCFFQFKSQFLRSRTVRVIQYL